MGPHCLVCYLDTLSMILTTESRFTCTFISIFVVLQRITITGILTRLPYTTHCTCNSKTKVDWVSHDSKPL